MTTYLGKRLARTLLVLEMIGDAVSPRRIHDALLEGTRVARAI